MDSILSHDVAALLARRWPSDSPIPPAATIVDTHPTAIGDLFAALPDDLLASVAEAVAVLRPLAPTPGWRFGSFGGELDLGVHVRHSLWLAAKARGRAIAAVVPWHGNTRLRLSLDNDLSRTAFAGGRFEPNAFALLDRVLQPGMIFVDGGANEGVFAIFAGARVGAEGRVVAVEPSAREADRLAANIALNEAGNIELVRAALADRAGTLPLAIAEDEHAGQNTLGAPAYEGVAIVGSEEVAVLTLDQLCADCRLDRLDIVKLDVEGAELRVLAGAQDALARYKPLILAEVSDISLRHQGGSAAELLAALRTAGYALLAFDDATGMPAPLPSVGGDAFDTVVAVHRERDWGLLTAPA